MRMPPRMKVSEDPGVVSDQNAVWISFVIVFLMWTVGIGGAVYCSLMVVAAVVLLPLQLFMSLFK